VNARRRAASRVTRRISRAAASPLPRSAGHDLRNVGDPAGSPRRCGFEGPPALLRGPDPIPANRVEMTAAERLAFIQAQRRTPVSPEEMAAHDELPWQTCPDCGRDEAAHWYCSACYLPMGPADWVPTVQSEAALHARLLARDAAVAHRATRTAVAPLGTGNRPNLGL